jgi:hypothetical protein
MAALLTPLHAQKLTFKIPPVRTSFLGDLSDLQQNITMILRTALNREDRCGDHIDIQHATLIPQTPSSLVVSELHFERWKCMKILGKERPNKLIGGNGKVEVKLTPVIDDGKTLKLVPDVGRIEADGALGDLLRSGSLGNQLREKIRASLLSAMQKGTDFKATLPAAVQDYATLENAQFTDAGNGNLDVVLEGRIHISDEQIRLLSAQVRARVAANKTHP